MLVCGSLAAIAAHGCELQLDTFVDILDVGLVDGVVLENHFLKKVVTTIADVIAIHLFDAHRQMSTR